MRHSHQHANAFRFRWGLITVGLCIGIAAIAGTGRRGLDDWPWEKPSADGRSGKTALGAPAIVHAAGAHRPAPGGQGLVDAKLRDRLAGLAPKGIYAVVDTAQNRLWLKKGGRVLLEARVSTGSRTTLIDPVTPGRRWTFETPRGVFAIQSKLKSPVWVKPDWAFVEEGKALPAALNDRMEAGVLGDYALGFGEGYFIHGTLYTRLLGQNVTHGCIRMADADLEFVYKNLPLGAPLFIF